MGYEGKGIGAHNESYGGLVRLGDELQTTNRAVASGGAELGDVDCGVDAGPSGSRPSVERLIGAWRSFWTAGGSETTTVASAGIWTAATGAFGPGEREGAEERRAMGESERGQWVCVEML